MAFFIVLLAVLFAAVFGWLALQPLTASAESPRPVAVVSTLASEKPGMEREALAKRLQELSAKPAPMDLKPGAMCYKPAGPPSQIEYVCPKCKEKSLYASPTDGRDANAWSAIWTIDRDLPACRRSVKEIKELTVEMDESQFCRKCQPGVKAPKLGLVIRYPGQTEPHRVCGVTSDDLRLIAEFLAGKTKHASANDEETPIKNHLKRLSELLGVNLVPNPSPR